MVIRLVESVVIEILVWLNIGGLNLGAACRGLGAGAGAMRIDSDTFTGFAAEDDSDGELYEEISLIVRFSKYSPESVKKFESVKTFPSL